MASARNARRRIEAAKALLIPDVIGDVLDRKRRLEIAPWIRGEDGHMISLSKSRERCEQTDTWSIG